MNNIQKVKNLLVSAQLSKGCASKRCTYCSLTLPLTYFKPTCRTVCKNCRSLANKIDYQSNRASKIASSCEYQKRPEAIELRHKRRPLSTRVVDPSLDSVKRAARNKVAEEIRRGRLVPQPCTTCDSVDNLHAHHEDYSLPLSIVWLCRACHIRLHKE